MRFDDFLAQAHGYPQPWAWGLRAVWKQPDGSEKAGEVWRWTIHSTKAEVVDWKKRAQQVGRLRDDVRFEIVRVYFDIRTAE